LSLLAVSCKKDEGGSKPTDPTPITITADSITKGFTTLGDALAIDVVKFNFSTFTASKTAAVEIRATETTDKANKTKITTGLQALKITVEGATVKLSAPQVPEVTTDTAITMDVTITPNGNNKFADDVSTKYKVENTSVVVSLKLLPPTGKKWNNS
ncbi:hypothetical protein, partial [Brachyspira aalborgi]|uniref:hypothetical protein n=1 Tax=Brachyspira aalborgi TaxID=29522 RepID=UPI00266DD516